jgi:hypothetical protein
VGLLTRADGGHDGPPDRFVVAELQGKNQMVRFSRKQREWEIVPVSPSQVPHARRMVLDHDVVAFGGHLWRDLGRPLQRPAGVAELPRDSVLPAAAQDGFNP